MAAPRPVHGDNGICCANRSKPLKEISMISRILGRVAKAAMVTLVAATMPLSITTPAQAGSNMAKVDIVAEGIDLAPIYVSSNANGYTGSEPAKHKFMVRVFAKASGQNRVWKVAIHSLKGELFERDVGKSEGWDVYGKSHEIWAKPGEVTWMTTPKEACDANLKKMVAAGKTKAQVLSNDRKTQALAFIYFTAYADSKANNKKGKHQSGAGISPHTDNTAYTVPVVCRMAL
jgi:hypothetical protein